MENLTGRALLNSPQPTSSWASPNESVEFWRTRSNAVEQLLLQERDETAKMQKHIADLEDELGRLQKKTKKKRGFWRRLFHGDYPLLRENEHLKEELKAKKEGREKETNMAEELQQILEEEEEKTKELQGKCEEEKRKTVKLSKKEEQQLKKELKEEEEKRKEATELWEKEKNRLQKRIEEEEKKRKEAEELWEHEQNRLQKRIEEEEKKRKEVEELWENEQKRLQKRIEEEDKKNIPEKQEEKTSVFSLGPKSCTAVLFISFCCFYFNYFYSFFGP